MDHQKIAVPPRSSGRRTGFFGILLLLAASGLPAVEPVPRESLTLEQAIALAERQGFESLIAEASVRAAQGDLAAAKSVPNPSFSGDTLRSTGVPAGGGTVSSAGYSLSLSDQGLLEGLVSGKRSLRVDAAEEALLSARSNRQDALRRLRLEVAEGFFAVLLAESVEAVDRDVARTFERTRELVGTRYRYGAVSEAELVRVETAWLEAQQTVTGAVGQVRQAKALLAYLLGDRNPTPGLEVSGSLEGEPPAWLREAEVAALRAQAVAGRPDLAAARADLERARSGLALAKRERLPDVSFSAGYGRQGPEANPVTPPTVSVGATLELPVFHQRQGPIERAAADLDAAQAAFERAAAKAASEVEAAWSAYSAAREQTDRMRGRLLESSRRSRELAELQYEKGATSLLDLLDAERTDLAVQLEYRQDLFTLRASVAQLETAVGRAVTP